jgi:hypothetical protein
LFVVAILAALTTVWMAVGTLSWQSESSEDSREAVAQAREAMAGAIDKLRCDYLAGSVNLPATFTETIGNANVALLVSNNSASLAKSMLVSAYVTVRGKLYRWSRVVTTPITPSPFYYALMSNSNFTCTPVMTTGSGGVNGDVECNGGVTISSASSKINGDLEEVGTWSVAGSVVGTMAGHTLPITFPTVSASNYQNAATIPTILNILSGEDFTLAPYGVMYFSSNTNLSGAYNGIGTIFINGNATVTANMSYLLAGSRVAFIVNGNLTVSSGVTAMVGYFFVTGSVTIAGSGTLTLNPGCLAANSFSISSPIAVTNDPTIYNTPTEGKNMKLPGFWP